MKSLIVVFIWFCIFPSTRELTAQNNKLALVGGKIYPSPTAGAIENGVVLISGTKIVDVGTKRGISIPDGYMVLDCSGTVLTAGYWNCHMHFGERKWAGADSLPAQQLGDLLKEMLTQYGFTTVIDLWGYDYVRAIQNRISAGEMLGPRIFRADLPIHMKGGTDYLPAEIVKTAHVVENPFEARGATRTILANGADVIKIYVGFGPSGAMSTDVVTAIAAEAHSQGKLVFAHPENTAGIRAAIDGRVDVVAHTITRDTVPQLLLNEMKQAGIALIPTVKSWNFWAKQQNKPSDEAQAMITNALDGLRRYSAMGGSILFGTDIGGITDYDPTEEYHLMGDAGMSFQQVLSSLTTAPAALFRLSTTTGKIAPGMDADIVVLSADPSTDLAAFARVKHTIRSGMIVY